MLYLFEEPLEKYEQATNEEFTKHWIANKFRNDYPDEIRELIINSDRYKIEGSPGKGNWTHCPWIAILDKIITHSPQKGYYPVILFKRDMTGFYLSLNQGVTEIMENYKREAKSVLKLKAEDFKAKIGYTPPNFKELEIDLNGSSNTVKLYEAGNIIAKFYSKDLLPDEVAFRADLNEILEIYEMLIFNDNSTIEEEKDEKQIGKEGIENFKKLRLHYRIERNQALIKKVKKLKGYVCEACDFSFEEKYGDLGSEFIEAHHLVPVSNLKGKELTLDAEKDFAVLCSNCHRMIHKTDDPSDVENLRRNIKNGQ